MVRTPDVPYTVATSTFSFGSFMKNFHLQSGCDVGQAGVGMVSVAWWAASSNVMTAVDEVSAALHAAPPKVTLRAINAMTELITTTIRFTTATSS